MNLNILTKFRHEGLLILRIGIGIMFILHGAPKVFGGPEKWEMLGKSMAVFGITFLPSFWGLMAALSEFLGGILLVIGFLTRFSSFFLLITMIVAASMHLNKGDGIMGASHAIESGILFLSLIIIGPGKISLDHNLWKGE